MSRTDPAMPFYVNDWLSSPRVSVMTLEQQGAYLRLLCFAWASQEAAIPDDDAQLAVLSGMGEGWLKGGCQMVRVCFEPHPQKIGFLTNKKLFALWQERLQWRQKSRLGGNKSAEKRRNSNGALNNELSNGGCNLVGECLQPKGNSPSPSPSPLNTKKSKPKESFVRPTVDEVRSYCLERNNGIDSQAFIDHYEANGWKVGRNPMKNWRAAIRTWEQNRAKSNGHANGHANGSPPKGRPLIVGSPEYEFYAEHGRLPE